MKERPLSSMIKANLQEKGPVNNGQEKMPKEWRQSDQ